MMNTKIYLALIISSLFLFEPYEAESITISAAQSGNWSNPLTWTGGIVPGEADIAQILVDAAVTITIDVDVTVSRLELGAGNTMAKKDILILDTDKILTVTGDFVWNRVGVFQQNAGSSVTAANYVVGTSGAAYSMMGWNVYGISENRASINGTGNIVAAAPTLPPVQQINWQYADINIIGYTALQLRNSWDANAYSSLNIDHCYFNQTGYVDIGQYANSANDLKITFNDFRNTSSVITGYNANLLIRTSVLSTLGNFSFEGNSFSGATQGKVYVTTIGNGREIKGNVFKNRSLDLAYLAAVPANQKSVKVYNNVFYASADAGTVNGLLIDYGGGAEIYENLFMGQTPNLHVILFPSGSATDPTSSIHNNVFDIDDGDADIIMPNYIPVTILENIFIGNGTPINLGLSGGGGGGSLSPNSGTVLVKNNTSYLFIASTASSIAGLAWAGETSQHTGGAITFINNLIGDSNSATTKAYKDSQSTPDLFDYLDYNWFFNGNGGSFINYEGVNKTGMTEGIDEGFGKFDQMGDPLFADPSRRITNFDASLGGNGTELNLISEMLKMNQNVPGETFIAGYTAAAGIQYIREGYTPGNIALDVSGQGGTYIGAIDYNYTSHVWTGAANTNWNTPENWSTNTVPAIDQDVTIPSGKTTVIAAGTSADCNNITIDAAGSLTIQSNSATNAGSLIVAGTASGNVSFESYLAETTKWHVVAAPVTGQNIWSFATLAGNSIAENAGKRAVTEYVEGINNWDTNYPSGDSEGNFSAGSGYSVLRSAPGLVSCTGTINTSDVSKPLTRSLYGWNALGNPYTSAINATVSADATNNLITANTDNFDPSFAALYVWDAATDQYVTINNAGNGTLVQNYIQAGQGFFVRAKDNSGLTFSITEAMKTHQPATPLKSRETAWPTIQLTVSGKGKLSTTVVTFNNQMTTGLDVTYDAGMFKADKNFALYTKLVDDNGVDFAVQALPDNRFNGLVIPLGIDVPLGTEIIFSAMAMNLPDEAAVYLEDRAAKTITQLDVADAKYMVTITEKTKGTGNFFLHTSVVSTSVSQIENNLKIYTRDRAIYINGKLNTDDIIAVYGIDGKLHYRKNAEKTGSIQIDAAKMPAGVYIISIQQNAGRVTRKVVISE